jgi:hypothetical protein
MYNNLYEQEKEAVEQNQQRYPQGTLSRTIPFVDVVATPSRNTCYSQG